jgi:glycosyltransferase involved in cell wall biosynthesis
MRSSVLYLIIPCYNEEEVLMETASRLKEKLTQLVEAGQVSPRSRIVFVNDGSRDHTWEIICNLHQKNFIFSGINLSKNRGHQNALLAGLMTVKDICDMAISMDADLQDDIDAVDEMVKKYHEGCEIVYGVRSKRDTDTFFKKFTAESFYKVMNLLGANTVYNHADYRLMSRKALKALSQYEEVNLFLRGIVPMIGYQTDTVTYERGERFAGESKYPLKKMLSFAFEGITSLSIKPIRAITFLGLFIFLVSILVGIYSLVQYFLGNTVLGWTSIVLSIWGVGGLILFSLGIVGEYIGKIYLETKHRPRFLVQEFLNQETSDE